MSGPDQPGTATQPVPPEPVAQRTLAQPAPASRPSGFDARSLAIGAGAGLLVLAVAGIAFGAARLGALAPADRQGAQQPGTMGQGPIGPNGPGMDGHGPRGEQRGPTGPLRGPFPRFRSPGTPGPVAQRRQISITAIAGSNLTLATADGWTRTIATTATTTITRAGQAITLADLKVGDQVRFQEVRNADGTYTVTAIDVVLPRVAGRVTATTADSITVQRADGTTVTIHVTSATTYRVRGVQNATLGNIAVGLLVVAQGTQNADGSLQALTVDAAATR